MFATAFAALESQRINTLTLTITPIDFHADTVENRLGHGFINIWTRSISPEDVDRLIDANGNLPGEFMGAIFNQMSPMRSLLKYNLDLLEIADDEERLMNWLRMEKWIADRPDHPGEAAKQWVKDLYQQNKLVRNEWNSGRPARGPRQHPNASLERLCQRRSHHPARHVTRPWREAGQFRLHRVGLAWRACGSVCWRKIPGAVRAGRGVVCGTARPAQEDRLMPYATGSGVTFYLRDRRRRAAALPDQRLSVERRRLAAVVHRAPGNPLHGDIV